MELPSETRKGPGERSGQGWSASCMCLRAHLPALILTPCSHLPVYHLLLHAGARRPASSRSWTHLSTAPCRRLRPRAQRAGAAGAGRRQQRRLPGPHSRRSCRVSEAVARTRRPPGTEPTTRRALRGGRNVLEREVWDGRKGWLGNQAVTCRGAYFTFTACPHPRPLPWGPVGRLPHPFPHPHPPQSLSLDPLPLPSCRCTGTAVVDELCGLMNLVRRPQLNRRLEGAMTRVKIEKMEE